jgi:hypothetical protein
VGTGTNTYTGQKAGEKGRGRSIYPAGGGGWGEEPRGWSREGGGAYFFAISGTSENSYLAFRECHDNIDNGTWPDVEYWNNVTSWTAP